MTIDYFCNTPSNQWDLIHTMISYDAQATYSSVQGLCQAIERDLIQFKEATEDQEKKALADKLLDDVKAILNLKCLSYEEQTMTQQRMLTTGDSGIAGDDYNIATQQL